MYRRILIASDLTDASTPALRTAIELGRQLGVPVTALHVLEPKFEAKPWYVPFSERDQIFFRDIERREEDAARRVLGSKVRELLAPHEEPAQVLTRAGIPADTIVAAARDLGADLIVVGTHGRRGFQHLIMGSVAERVARQAQCATMIVHPEVR
jgi:nucleotide-binding universal stress UspA family protein